MLLYLIKNRLTTNENGFLTGFNVSVTEFCIQSLISFSIHSKNKQNIIIFEF